MLESSPEIIVLTCCGFEIERTTREGELLAQFEKARNLPAVREGRVYATDASHFFSRPGPRIVESLEILAHIIHPETFPPPPLPDAFRRITL